MMLTPGEWYQTGAWIPFHGGRLFVSAQGTGAPVLALHGFPTASYDFTRVLPLLRDHYRLILFDYPGFGFSDKPRRYPYSLFTYADAAQAVADHFGLTRVRLFTHDIGDSVGLELLRRGSPSVERLVMMNGSVLSIPFDDPSLRALQKLMLNPHTGGLIVRLRLFRRATFARMFNRIFAAPLSDREIDAFWSLIQHNGGRAIYHLLMRYMLERWQHQHTWLEALSRHDAPLTLIWGMADPVASPAVAEAVIARRPDAACIQLDNIGHYPHWEAPERVAAAAHSALA